MTDGRRDARRGPGRPVWPVRFLSAGSALAILASPLQAQKALARRIEARVDAAPFDRNLWGIALVDPQGRLLYGRNADRLFVPASNTKIVVSAVAAALFPPDWTVRTSLYGSGPLMDGVLRGDLVLYGRGDPTFDVRCYATDTTPAGVCDRDPFQKLRALANSLKALGVRTVAGDVVGDGSYFEPATVHPDWQSFDLNWWYAAPVSGLAFNDNSVDIAWGPGPAVGAPVVLSLTPDLGDVMLENRSRTVGPDETTDIQDRMFREPGTLQLWAEGTVAINSAGGTESFALPDPSLYAARALRSVLLEAGVAVTGTTRSTTDSVKYRGARETAPLAEIVSRPVKDWIFPILNTSQNLIAEMLLKQLGKQFGRAGSWQEGLAVERRFLIDSIKVDSTQFDLDDGSGLANQNLVSPLAFVRILRFIRGHPHFASFGAGLPQSGQPGSLRKRFVGTPLEGKVWAKSGSIGRVNTLSGFIELDRGRTLTFSIQANNHTQADRPMLALLDSLVVEMGRK